MQVHSLWCTPGCRSQPHDLTVRALTNVGSGDTLPRAPSDREQVRAGWKRRGEGREEGRGRGDLEEGLGGLRGRGRRFFVVEVNSD